MEPAKLGKIIKEITAKYTDDGQGINILASPDEFKSTYQILLELSKVWDDLTDTESAYLLEKIAGKHRATALQSILSNEETLIRAYETALNSSGSAMEEFEKRTESVEYHLNQLKATWQEVASDTVPTEFIISVIDAARAALEFANNIGILKIAVAGFMSVFGLLTNVKILPYFEAQGKKLGEVQEKVKIFGKEFYVAGEHATVGSKRLAGAVNTITTAVKTIGKGTAVGLIASALTFVGLKAFEYFDEQKNKVNNLSASISDLSSEIDSLQKEYNELNSVSNKTEGDERKLKLLEKEIELKQKQLELEKQEKTDTVISDTSEYFDGYVTKSDFSDKMQKAEKAAQKYKDSLDDVDEKNDDLKKHSKALENMSEEAYDYESIASRVSTAENKLSIAINESQSAQKEGIATLQELLPLREDLVYAVENSTGALKKQAQANLDNFDATYKELEILYGVADSYEHLNDKIREQSTSLDVLETVLAYANKGQSVSKEMIDELKERYPELSDVINTFASDADGAYTISADGIKELDSVHAQALLNLIDNQIEATDRVLIESQARIASYKEEAAELSKLFGASWETAESNKKKEFDLLKSKYYEQKGKNGDWHLKDEYTWEEYSAAANEIYKKYSSQSSNQYYAKMYAEKERMDKINADAYKSIYDAKKRKEELLKQRSEAQIATSGFDSDGDNPLSGSTDAAKKAVDVWDEYANALAKAQEQVESFNAAVELTQAKLDFNQSKENRTTDLLVEEQELYDELLKAQQARYKIVNDTLWLQQQQLKTTQQEVAEQLKARSPKYNISDLANWTQADVDRYIEFELDVDTNEADAKLANHLNYLLAMGESVDEYHQQWYELKQELAETEVAQLQVEIDWQNDTLDKFDEARGNAELLLDILEEMEGTEEQRLELIEALSSTYDTEFGSTLEMHKQISDKLIELGKEGLQDTDEYNLAMNQRVALEEHALETIQGQLKLRKQQIETEKELAIRQLETSIYGEQGQEAWEKSRESEIERLRNQLDALEDDSSEADYLEEIAEKEKTIAQLEEKLANLRQQRTIKQLKQEEDGSWQWEYVTDQKAIDETLAELEDAKNDLRKTQEDRALEEQKDAIQDRIDAIEQEIEDKDDYYMLEMEKLEEHYAKKKEMEEQAAADQLATLQKQTTDVTTQLNELERRTGDGLEEVAKKTDKGMGEISSAYNSWFTSIYGDMKKWVTDVIDEFNRLEAARRAAEEEAAGMTGGASGASADGSYANGLKFVEANNFLARLHYGERVLTRQEAAQYNELEDDIKSGKLQAYFDSLKEDVVLSMSNVAANAVSRTTTVPTMTSNTTQFVIEHLELPEVKDPTDFAAVINEWAKGEFGGMAQRAKIVKAK